MRVAFTTTAFSLTLLACQPIEPKPGPDHVEDACGASDQAHLVGAHASSAAGLTHEGPVRILRPGEMVTLEFRGDRLNIALDARDRIERVYCG